MTGGAGRLVRFAARYWRGYALIALLTPLASLLSLLHPWPVQILVDHVLGGMPAPGWVMAARTHLPGGAGAPGAVAWLAAAGLVLFALESLLEVVLTMAWIRTGQRMVYDLSCRLFASLVRRSPLFHARAPVGDLLARINGDAWCVYNAAALLMGSVQAVVVIGGVVWVMSRLDVTLTLVALAAAPVLALCAGVVGRRVRAAKGAERQAESGLESHVQQALTGIPVVQAFAQEERESRRFGEMSRLALGAQRRSALLAAVSTGTGALVSGVATAAVLGLGAREVLAARMSIGQLLVFLAYVATLQGQLGALARSGTELIGLGASMRRVREVMDVPAEVRELPGAAALSAPRGCLGLRFESVTFGYEPDRPVLRGICMDIPAGATVGIVGPSGAGKSTLAGLVPRLFDPWEGRVLIGERDAREISLKSLRRRVAVVQQEPVLLATTIAECIAGDADALSRARIEAAAAAAGADQFIAALPGGYDSIIGERGATLSGGERQRLALARALFREPSLLILDETTSALDAGTEEQVLGALREGRGRRTTVVIAHRLWTVRHADWILVLDAGRVVEAGPHAELARAGGLYERLWRSQTRAAPIAAGAALEKLS